MSIKAYQCIRCLACCSLLFLVSTQLFTQGAYLYKGFSFTEKYLEKPSRHFPFQAAFYLMPAVDKEAVLEALPTELAKRIKKLATEGKTNLSEVACLRTDGPQKAGLLAGRYKDRATSGQCDSSPGMWKYGTTAPIRRWKYDAMARVLGLSQRHVVLDWGTGCGTEISFTARRYGFQAIGVDLMESNVEWARSHLAHATYCVTPVGRLPLSDESIDAVISNGVLFHLDGLDNELKALREFLRVLRPGGCGWMAWLGCDDDPVEESMWKDVHIAGGVVAAINEIKVLRYTEYSCEEAYSLLFCKDSS